MPHSIDTAYWKRLGALLEEALRLAPGEREAWLASLGDADAPYRAALAGMLARAGGERDDFMELPVAAGTLEAASETLVADQPGDLVGPYRLVSRVGAGGMGTVWRAERADGSVQRQVALKLPRTGWSPGLADRLRHESAILSTLEHPGIARLYDAGLTEAGRPWLAMEIIDGVPVDRYCADHGLDVRARLSLFLQVARAVSYAHARLVVHRDIKPANILVDGRGQVHLVDFGLARLLDETAARPSDLTQAMGRTLTPDYASPEQIRGEAITVASDTYSLGVVLYELLAGKRPYRLKRDSAAALEEAILEADVPAASSQATSKALARLLRGDLDTILAKALRKNASGRYPNVDALAADVERHLRGEPVVARPASFSYVAGRFVRRHRVAVVAAALVAVAVAAGLGGTIHQARQAAAGRDQALRELRFAEAAEEFTRFLLSEQSNRPLPAAELLRRAARSAREQFADDGALRARMQLLLADLHGELADFKSAEALVLEARRSAEAASDRWLVVQADCVQAAILGATGRSREAVERFAAVMPAVEADPSADPTSAQVCYSQRSITLRNLGKADESARDAEAALRALDAAPGANRVNRIFLRTNVADALTNAGRLPEAVRIYEQATADLGRIGRGGTSAGLLMANNLIVILTRAGQPRRAVEAYERLVVGDDPDPPAFSSLSINYARVLFDVGRRAQAERLLEEGRREKVRLGDGRGEAFALLARAGFACTAGEAGRCEALLGEVTPRMTAMLPAAHSTFATIRYLSAMAATARGEAARARALLEAAVAHYDAAPDRNLHVVRALSLLAAARSRAGEPDAARAAIARAVELARKAAGGFEHSAWLGAALLAQARLHAGMNEVPAALAVLAEARAHLAGSVGKDSPSLAEADALAGSLAR